ncbi:hybrid sensor histidine kinase/response regulator transcription factor [Pseudochryseolinea flava]|uniref:hybrid sensor histidine kinase/response regulator transcription factor n=1 Tax=Pseudochryseolinea flava TaxID=2059302 RepID=UPI001403E0FA|nr:hybrid sensor histidine kinase/response regulator transcription factor [Pseudochryseolinea flava]
MLLGLLLFCSASLFGQQANVLTPLAPETLSNTFVRCFYKDSRGLLWIGTADGLVRFDGTNTHRYEHESQLKNSLCHNNINAIVEDKNHRLWIGTAQGISIYTPQADSFTTLDSLPGLQNYLNNRYITALAFDQHGSLWIGTHEGGINVFNPEKLHFTYLLEHNNDKNFAGANYVNALLCVDDMMWCGTKGGLRIYNTREIRPAPISFRDDQLPAGQITTLVADNMGNVWMTNVNGDVMKVTPRHGYYTLDKVVAGELSHGTGNTTLTLARDLHGNFWFGGEKSGLNYLDVKTRKVSKWAARDRSSDQLLTSSIRAVYVDDKGLVWIGTFNKGAYLIKGDSKKFLRNSFNGSENNFAGKQVRGFAEDGDGNIWIVADEIGVGKVDAKTNTLSKVNGINSKLPNKYLNAIICDRHGDIWIGSAGNGVYRVDPTTFQMVNFTLKSESFGDNKVSCLYEDKSGTIWAGTLGSGLFYYDQQAQAFKVLYEADKANHLNKTTYVSSILEDSYGLLWIGTAYGLYSLENTHGKNINYTLHLPAGTSQSISSSGIQCLHEDKRKNLWIGTADNGVTIRMASDSQIYVFRKSDGLGANNVRAITSDASGVVWVSGNSGLSKFNQEKRTFITYSYADGLSSENFYGNACLRSSSGQIFFGSNDGFVAFYPDSIRHQSDRPVVHLTDLRINNRSVPIGTTDSPLKQHIGFTKSIVLSSDQRSFVIDFATIDISQSLKRKYCYKLEGFDKGWNCIDGTSSATYTNMDPGDYVFNVRASDGDGGWSDEITRLEITVRPVIWKTWWAFLLYCVVLAIVLLLIIRVRKERVKMKQQLTRERMAREREHTLSESKAQFFNNISHEFRTPLSLMLIPLESLMDQENLPVTARNKVASAYRSANKMMKLVNELMDFNKIESGNLKLYLQFGEIISVIGEVTSAFDDVAQKRNILYSVNAAEPIVNAWFDHDKLDKILLNVLSNAFKFTRDGGRISVDVSVNVVAVGEEKKMMRCLEIVVLDNGLGIAASELPHIFDKFYQAKSASRVANPGTGIGLSWTKALVELHHGFINVESIPDQETKFRLVIPIDAAAFQLEIAENLYGQEIGFGKNATSSDLKIARMNSEAHHEEQKRADVLVVEDNDDLRESLVAELQRDFNVLQARDGVEGLHLALEKIPDIIISDILMPNKTGIELCATVKADIKTSHIPFILLTAKATVQDQIYGIDTGADVYLTKPFSIRLLLAHVQGLIASREKLYSLFSQDVYLLPARSTSDELDKMFLQRVVDYIVEHLQDSQLGVDALADAFNLSRVQVYRKVKALTGKTAVEFIRNVRLKQAIKLMETKKYTLSEISYQTGFSSASYFTKCFKEAYGKAPSEFLAASA